MASFQRLGSSTGSFLSKPDPLNWLDWYRCSLDTYLAQLRSLLVLHTFNNRRLKFPANGGQLLLTGEKDAVHNGNNGFTHTREYGTRFFIVAAGYEAAHLWVVDGSQKGVNYSEKKKRRIADYTTMKRITITANYVFVRHRFLRNARAGYSGPPWIRYHIVLIPDVHPLKDAISLAYVWMFKNEGKTSSNKDKSIGGKSKDQGSDGP